VASPSSADKPLIGRHAVVTGAGSGIGAAIAEGLAGLGASLTLIGRNRERLAAKREELQRVTDRVAEAVLDVTRTDDVQPVFDAAAARFGPPSILVNNAGAAESAPFLKTEIALLDRMLAVNLRGAFACARAALPGMLAARHGRIVNIASTAGLAGYAYVSAYCAAKHAVVGLTRALALELAKTGVTVNAVCPGFTDTDLAARAVEMIVAKTGRTAEAARAELADTNPMGRLMTPQEIASAVTFLCLPQSGAITGQAIVVAGGEVMN
jgi:NAD(P)-dependent dehydrogenase (short-subunit alcohol dehydrogenase family)